MTESRRALEHEPLSSPAADFAERVMSAVASSPAPSAPRSFVVAARERKLGDATGSLVVAWHLALRGRVPALIRLQALGLVAVVALSAGAGAVAASAAAYRVAAPIVSLVMREGAPDERTVPSSAPTFTARPSPVRAPVVADPGPGDRDDDDVDGLDARPGLPASVDEDEAHEGDGAEDSDGADETHDDGGGDPDSDETEASDPEAEADTDDEASDDEASDDEADTDEEASDDEASDDLSEEPEGD